MTANSALCIGCGLCCDGTLFSGVRVIADDGPRGLAELHGLRLAPGEKQSVPQPCIAFARGICTVHQDRPENCRQYTCALFDLVAAGETGLEDARELIQETRAAAARVRPGLEQLVEAEPGTLALPRLFGLLDERLNGLDVSQKRAHAELLLDIGALRVLLRRHFERWEEPAEKEQAAAQPAG